MTEALEHANSEVQDTSSLEVTMSALQSENREVVVPEEEQESCAKQHASGACFCLFQIAGEK